MSYPPRLYRIDFSPTTGGTVSFRLNPRVDARRRCSRKTAGEVRAKFRIFAVYRYPTVQTHSNAWGNSENRTRGCFQNYGPRPPVRHTQNDRAAVDLRRQLDSREHHPPGMDPRDRGRDLGFDPTVRACDSGLGVGIRVDRRTVSRRDELRRAMQSIAATESRLLLAAPRSTRSYAASRRRRREDE